MESPLFVVIAAAGRPQLLDRTLRSLAACDKPPSYRGAIVVENGAPCGLEAVVRRGAGSLSARYFYVEEPNKSHALNLALDQIDAGLIYFLDDDVRLAPGTLIALASAARDRHRGNFFGGPLHIDYETPPPPWLLPYLPFSARGWSLPYQKPTEIRKPKFMGANWAAYARDLRAIGGFDTHRGPGSPTKSSGQESDAQDRLLADGAAGYYAPDMHVWHFVPADRCTPQWALERARRHGMGSGLKRRHPLVHAARLPYLAANWAAAHVQRRVLSLAESEERRFHAEYKLASWSAKLESHRQGRKAA